MLPPQQKSDEIGRGNGLDLPPQSGGGEPVDPREQTTIAPLFGLLRLIGPEPSSKDLPGALQLEQGPLNRRCRQMESLRQLRRGDRPNRFHPSLDNRGHRLFILEGLRRAFQERRKDRLRMAQTFSRHPAMGLTGGDDRGTSRFDQGRNVLFPLRRLILRDPDQAQ